MARATAGTHSWVLRQWHNYYICDMNMRKKQVPRHPGEQLLRAKVLGGAVGGGLKNLAGRLFDGQKGVDFKQVGKAALGGALIKSLLLAKASECDHNGTTRRSSTAAPKCTAPTAAGLPFQQQPGGILNHDSTSTRRNGRLQRRPHARAVGRGISRSSPTWGRKKRLPSTA